MVINQIKVWLHLIKSYGRWKNNHLEIPKKLWSKKWWMYLQMNVARWNTKWSFWCCRNFGFVMKKKVMQNEDFDHFEPVFCGPEPWKKLYHKPTIKTSLFTISLKNQRCLQNPSLRCRMFFKIVDCNSNLTQLYFYLMFCILLKSLWISRKQCTVYHGSS